MAVLSSWEGSELSLGLKAGGKGKKFGLWGWSDPG